MKHILKPLLFSLLALNLTLNSAFGFDNYAEMEKFSSFAEDKQILQKLKSLCMQDKLWMGNSKKPKFFREACYGVAGVNLNPTLYDENADKVEQREDLDLMKKACSIDSMSMEGCMGFTMMVTMLKERLNLSEDYVSKDKDIKGYGFFYLKRACDKEWSIFTKNKGRKMKHIDGFFGGTTCGYLSTAYRDGFGTDKDSEKAAFYEKRDNEIEKGMR